MKEDFLSLKALQSLLLCFGELLAFFLHFLDVFAHVVLNELLLRCNGLLSALLDAYRFLSQILALLENAKSEP